MDANTNAPLKSRLDGWMMRSNHELGAARLEFITGLIIFAG